MSIAATQPWAGARGEGPAHPRASIAPPAPLRLPEDLRLTPRQFERVCQANPSAVLELTSEGQLIVLTPTGSETSGRNSRLVMRLLVWADQRGGWKVFDSSGGFHLPDGSVLSPDASLLRLERWRELTAEQRRGFAPLCPDLVVELASPHDEGLGGVSDLRRKMAQYQANGARQGWLLLPAQRAVEIWPSSGSSWRLEAAELLEGGTYFPGLQLKLAEIWEG